MAWMTSAPSQCRRRSSSIGRARSNSLRHARWRARRRRVPSRPLRLRGACERRHRRPAARRTTPSPRSSADRRASERKASEAVSRTDCMDGLIVLASHVTIHDRRVYRSRACVSWFSRPPRRVVGSCSTRPAFAFEVASRADVDERRLDGRAARAIRGAARARQKAAAAAARHPDGVRPRRRHGRRVRAATCSASPPTRENAARDAAAAVGARARVLTGVALAWPGEHRGRRRSHRACG